MGDVIEFPTETVYTDHKMCLAALAKVSAALAACEGVAAEALHKNYTKENLREALRIIHRRAVVWNEDLAP